MTKPLPWSGRIALLLVLPAALLPLLFAGQRSTAPVRPAQLHASGFHDWTTHHAVYGHTGALAALEAARSDPRALFRWREIEQQSQVAQTEAQQRQLQSFLQFRFPGRPGRLPVRGASDVLGRSNINTLTTFAAGVTNPANGTIPNSSTGITGMVVDNASASAQAASIYFGSRGSNTAIKLTQAGFQ